MFKVGIIGCGGIARNMAFTLTGMEDAELVAVAARDETRAKTFAEEYKVKKAYGSYTELFKDPEVELVYMGTLNCTHKENMLEAISYGKNILCEKPFTINRKEAEEVFEAAKAKGVYVAEAMWTRYMPSAEYIRTWIEGNKLGAITTITGNLSYPIYNMDRIKYPELGGGAILDLGPYPLNFSFMFLPDQDVKEMTGTCVKNEYGVDIKNSLSITSTENANLSLFTDATTRSDRRGLIYLDKGMIEVDNINDPHKVSVYEQQKDWSYKLIEEKNFEHKVFGFEHEVAEAARCIAEGLQETPKMPWMETLKMMTIIENFRKLWNVKVASEM